MKITIIHPVQCDGKGLKPGSEVDLPNEVADGLVACGAAEPVTKTKAAAPAKAQAEPGVNAGDGGALPSTGGAVASGGGALPLVAGAGKS